MKKFLATVVATVAALAPTGALAGNNNIDEHQHLWDTVQRIGVNTLVNNPHYCDRGVAGMYSPQGGLLVVCQEDAKYNNGKMVEWTNEDLDTLRHEAHHIVQDCVNRRLGDGHLSPLFGQEKEYEDFVLSILSKSQIEWIIKQYHSNGADKEVLLLEVEAFAVAAGVGPLPIADALVNHCGVK